MFNHYPQRVKRVENSTVPIGFAQNVVHEELSLIRMDLLEQAQLLQHWVPDYASPY